MVIEEQFIIIGKQSTYEIVLKNTYKNVYTKYS